MADLPTCWYCPECGRLDLRDFSGDIHRDPNRADSYGNAWDCYEIPVQVPIIPPGTPLPVILDALGHTYQASIVAAMEVDVLGGPVSICYAMNPPLTDGAPVLVVDNPAPVEAHDG